MVFLLRGGTSRHNEECCASYLSPWLGLKNKTEASQRPTSDPMAVQNMNLVLATSQLSKMLISPLDSSDRLT